MLPNAFFDDLPHLRLCTSQRRACMFHSAARVCARLTSAVCTLKFLSSCFFSYFPLPHCPHAPQQHLALTTRPRQRDSTTRRDDTSRRHCDTTPRRVDAVTSRRIDASTPQRPTAATTPQAPLHPPTSSTTTMIQRQHHDDSMTTQRYDNTNTTMRQYNNATSMTKATKWRGW